jgi:UDP-N-acetylmuramate dehydrogenase
MLWESNRSLKDLTTLGVGGVAHQFVEVQTVADLQRVIFDCSQNCLRYFILGKGSNIVFDDLGFFGVVIHNKINFFEEKNEGSFVVGAGYSFSLLGVQTAKLGFEGLEFAAGIPGSVGGAVCMNAGSGGGETFDFLVEVYFVNEKGEVEIIPKKEISFGYRFSSFQDRGGAIALARFDLKKSKNSRQKQLEIIAYRLKTQPYSSLSAGCVFRNPKEFSAGKLIEKCQLKGYSIGGAEVSNVHANFIINKGDATAKEILDLATYVRDVVLKKTGYKLEMEIKIIPYKKEW